jgi:hypothetical protein
MGNIKSRESARIKKRGLAKRFYPDTQQRGEASPCRHFHLLEKINQKDLSPSFPPSFFPFGVNYLINS